MINTAQVLVPSGSAVPLASLPPGVQVTVTVLGGTISGIVPIANPFPATPSTLWAISAAGTIAAGIITAVPR